MEQIENKLPKNVDGKYYIIDECNGCAYCASIAPENFDFDKPTNTYFVSRQPGDTNEEELVEEAMNDCPVDAIRVVETTARHAEGTI